MERAPRNGRRSDKRNPQNMNNFVRAAIIGYYRSGAKWEEITGITKLDIVTIKIMLAKYLKTKAILL